MKANFAKALVLAIALALALSGCNLIGIDAKMQADEDIAKIDKSYSVAAATYDGGEVTAGEAISDFNNTYSLYTYLGITVDQTQLDSIVESVLTQRVRSEIAAAHYDELGHSLSEEELSEVESTAQSSYEANLESVMPSANGKNDEERAEYARVTLRANGMDYDALYDSGLLSAKNTALEEVLRAEIEELTDEELQAAYDEKVAEQQSSFTDGSSFENAMTGDSEIICWQPDGYRTVKHILVMPSDETKAAYSTAASDLRSAQTALDDLKAELEAANAPAEEDADADAEDADAEELTEDSEDARSAEEIQADIDAAEATLADCEAAEEAAAQACLDEVKETTDEIYSRLEAGESFEDLIAEYGEDPGMQNEPTMTRGYCVSAESTNWEVNFRDAAMALAQVGDYTLEPVVSGSGVHIIQYTGDIAGGEVPLDDVREKLTEETLENRKSEHVTETIDAWVEEANPSYDVVAFENAVLNS